VASLMNGDGEPVVLERGWIATQKPQP
jgi:hypothetical protein